MTALWADDENEGYRAPDATEVPPLPEPIRGFEADPPQDQYADGAPYALYEQDLYDVPDDVPDDDPYAVPAAATPREDGGTPSHLSAAAICAGVCAAVVAAGVTWLIVRSRRRVSPARRAARLAAHQFFEFSERSRRAAAQGGELVEPLEGHARRGVTTSIEAAARLRRRAETLRHR